MRLRARIAMLMLIGLVLVTTGCTPALMAIQTEFAARGATEAEQEDAVRVAACESGGGDPLSIQPAGRVERELRDVPDQLDCAAQPGRRSSASARSSCSTRR